MYNSCTTKARVGSGTDVTRYPFEEQVQFTLGMQQPVQFPFYLRVPGWCKGASVKLNGKEVNLNAAGGSYIRLEQEWKNGDQVVLSLPMSLTARTWQVNQNSVSVNYGPLTFSLKIAEDYKKISSTASAIGDSKWQKDADQEKWPAYTIDPVTPWNYGLILDKQDLVHSLKVVRKNWPADNYPFSQANVPIEIRAKGRLIPSWGIDQYGLVDVLPRYPARAVGPVRDITLIPMGAARLRISAFPPVRDPSKQ